jgi:hypothetical protein
VDAHPELAQLGDRLERRVLLADDRAFRDLQLQLLRGEPGLLQDRGDGPYQVELRELATAGLRSSSERTWAHASRSAQRPIETINPVSSAIGMNSLGGMMPRSPCCQRISASTACTRPVSRATMGW